MTKRNHNFGEKYIKKQKLDDDIDALWGDDDDIDESALDDCIKLATQVLEEEKVICESQIAAAKIPSYSFFKEPAAKIFSSTQQDFLFSQPGTSKDFPSSNKENATDVEKEFVNLQQRYQEKEGEVTILRTHLKETKNNFNNEQSKVQNEWKKKLVIAEKQIHSVKSELEFKNLEIANLKQKLIDVTKRTTANKDLNAVNNKTYEPSTSTTLFGTADAALKLHAVIDTSYPLHQFNTDLILNFPKKEKHVLDSGGFQSSRNSIVYLQNQRDSNRMCLSQCETSISIRPILQKLISSTETQLNSEEFLSDINKVIITTDKLLDDLLKLLQQIKLNLKTENILQADTTYLKNEISHNIQSKDDNVIGFNAGTIIDFLAELLPYSDYLKKLFSTNEKVNLKKGVYGDIYISYGQNTTGFGILDKIVDIMKLAGEIRESNMLLFFNSSIKLFLNICKSGYYNSITELFCVFTKELIFLRPHYSIVYKITELFKEASAHSSFVEFILNKSKSCSTLKKGIIYFNSDACRFYIFALMFEKCDNREPIPMDICLNMLCFIYNTFKTSNWIHHQDTKECECLPYLYKLVLEILYRSIVIYEEMRRTNQEHLSEWKYLIENRIIIKIVSLMTFHSYDLTEKYITMLSKYKEIERYFEEDQTITDIERLSILEELPEVPVQNFNKISF